MANFVIGAQLLEVPSIGEISATYATNLTPASYAFSIWPLIYLWLIVFVVYQARDIVRPRDSNTLPYAVGPWFIVASIANGAWTYIFVSEAIGASVLVLLTLTASLYVLLWRLKIATDTPTPQLLMCVWWPLMIYTGWVTVASVVNAASWFASLGLPPTPIVASGVLGVLMVALLVLLATRNVREILLACAWGIVAIGVEQWSTAGSTLVMVSAFGVATVLIGSAVVHAYKHRNSFMTTSQS